MSGLGGYPPYYPYYSQPNASSNVMNWSQYMGPDGRQYYYNNSTGETSYEVPKSASVSDDQPAWAEYKEENSGKKYYYNRITKQCVWEEPEELRVLKAREEAKKMGFLAAGDSTQSSQIKDAKGNQQSTKNSGNQSWNDTKTGGGAGASGQNGNHDNDDHSSSTNLWEELPKQEATRRFKALLLDKNVSSVTKWPEAMRLIINDNRWSCFRTLGEKKQAFAEYQTQRAKDEKVEKREKTKKAREEFMKMLAACEKINSRTRWRDAITILSEDPCFKAVESPHDREDLFMDFVTELGRTEREYRRKERQELRDAYQSLLKEMEGKLEGKITSTHWMDMEKIKEFCEDVRYQKVESSDRRHWFDDYIADLRDIEKEIRKKEHEERKKKERELAAVFKTYLLQFVDNGTITAISRWKELIHLVEKDESFLHLVEHSEGDLVARSVFEEIVDSLRVVFKEHKYAIMDFLRDSDFVVTDQVTYDEFISSLLSRENSKGSKEISSILTKSPANVKIIYEDLMERVMLRKKEEDRKLQEKREAFLTLLTEYYYRSDHVGIAWATAKEEIKHRTAFKSLPEPVCNTLFDEYMADLLAKKEARTKSVQKREKEELEEEQLKKQLNNVSVSNSNTSRCRHRKSSDHPSSRSRSLSSSGRKRSKSNSSSSPPNRRSSPLSSPSRRDEHKKRNKEKDRKRSRKHCASDSGDDEKSKRKSKHKKSSHRDKKRHRKRMSSISSAEEGRIKEQR